MTDRKEWLADFDESKRSKVKLVDNSSLQEESTYNIVFQMINGGKAMNKDVLYVPGMKCNLLSVGQLVKKSFSVVMKDGVLRLFDTKNNLVLKSPLLKNRIFKTMISSTEVQYLKTVFDHKDSWLWDLRFGHLNFRSLNQLITQDMVTGIPSLEMPEKHCEGCLVGKQSRNSFVSTMSMRSSCILEVVHSDVCGPFEEHTIFGNKYFNTKLSLVSNNFKAPSFITAKKPFSTSCQTLRKLNFIPGT